MGEGRFGPLFRAHAADGSPVVVRTFVHPFTDEQRDRFLGELAALCERPLDHPSIARPLAFGEHERHPYLVHTYLPGTSLEDRQAVADLAPAHISLRLTYLAGALDFAAAVGVLHGALSPADVIFSTDTAGVSGFGLVQALEAAGVEGYHARREDDIAALVAIARDLLGARAPRAAVAVLSAPPPASALEFAAALQSALQPELPLTPRFEFEPEQAPPLELAQTPEPDVDRTPAASAPFDFPLREEAPPEPEPEPAYVPEREPEPVPSAPMLFGTTDDAVTQVEALRVRRRRRPWLLIAAVALGLGVLAGFAGGFFVARENPVSAPAPVVTTPAAPQPEPTNGRTFTDASVDEAPKPGGPPSATAGAPTATTEASRPASAAAAPAPVAAGSVRPPAAPPSNPRPAAAPRSTRTAPAPPSGPAAMRVDSLPAGAQVFVDGRSVGYTPMVVGDLAPGTHSIRMQLPGYQPWVTAVTLGPGARERVSASLEP